MAEDETIILNIYKTIVRVGSNPVYALLVHSEEKHWTGTDHGGAEGAPGDYLETKVILDGIEGGDVPSLDKAAVERRVVLGVEPSREITSKPAGYAKAKHNQVAEEVRMNGKYWVGRIPKALKEAL